MSDDIKVLALRVIAKQREDELGKLFNDAADALEALVEERDRLKAQNIAWADKYGDTQNAMYAALNERDRLRAAPEEIADKLNRRFDSSRSWEVKSIYDFAFKVLEAKE
jgi:hypothetical protein